MELWYFGMSFAGSQYMDGLEGWRGDGAVASPPGEPAAFWSAVFFTVWFSVTFDLIKELSLCSKEMLCSQAKRGSSALSRENQSYLLTPPSFSVLLCSRWFHLSLTQRLCLRPAPLGRPVVCHRHCLSVVQRRLQRTISVMARRCGLAAAVGVVVWNGRRFYWWMGGTVGLSWLRFDLICWRQLSTIHWVTWIVACNTCQRKMTTESCEIIKTFIENSNNKNCSSIPLKSIKNGISIVTSTLFMLLQNLLNMICQHCELHKWNCKHFPWKEVEVET